MNPSSGTFGLRRYETQDRAALQQMLGDSSLKPEFGWLLENGELEDPLRHPFGDPEGPWIAEQGGGLAAFAMALRLVSKRSDATLLRLGVLGSARRQGIGGALLAATLDRLRRTNGPGHLLTMSHWLPAEPAIRFALRHGFAHNRFFWSMERTPGPVPRPEWPPGVEVKTFDAGDQAFEDWNDCFNTAFAETAFSPTSTVEACRRLAATPHFDPAGLLLAHRGGDCVGFCRNALLPDCGEVDVLGVVPAARGIGLGRALLRWGAGWLTERGAPCVRLMVDGENETALSLYRSERFEVIRTRQIWSRTVGTY